MSDNIWKDVLVDAAVASWVFSEANAGNPEKLLADLLAQVRREALDPAISEAAAQLVAGGFGRAKKMAAQVCKELHELYCKDLRGKESLLARVSITAVYKRIRALQPQPAQEKAAG